MAREIWWAVARSEEVTAGKPFGVHLGDQPIVLWRDAEDVVRALEDRCPHRRAPLSLGCVLGNGMIQCGYHGWTFEGGTGRLKNIPNLKGTQRFPPVYRAQPYPVTESGGFVRLCLEEKARAEPIEGEAWPLSGSTDVTIDHAQFVAALFDDPGLVISITGVRFTPYLLAELHADNGLLVHERSCQWMTPHWPAPFSGDFPLTLRIATHPVTGESELLLRDDELNVLLRVRLAPVPAARGVTQLRWRAKLGDARKGVMPKLLGARTPFSVKAAIDGAALRVLRPSASIHADDLRKQLESDSPSSAVA